MNQKVFHPVHSVRFDTQRHAYNVIHSEKKNDSKDLSNANDDRKMLKKETFFLLLFFRKDFFFS